MSASKEEIEKRKEKSRQRYRALRKKQDNIKKGRLIFADAGMEMGNVTFDNVVVAFSILYDSPCAGTPQTMVWCVCSSKDTYSPRIARGLLGYRAATKAQEFMHTFETPCQTNVQAAHRFIAWMVEEAFKVDCKLCDRLRRAIRKETKNSHTGKGEL